MARPRLGTPRLPDAGKASVVRVARAVVRVARAVVRAVVEAGPQLERAEGARPGQPLRVPRPGQTADAGGDPRDDRRRQGTDANAEGIAGIGAGEPGPGQPDPGH